MAAQAPGMLAVALMVLAAAAPPARADEAGPEACDAPTAERLRFLETRLERRREYADWWWKGWTTTYGTGMLVQSVRAGLEDDSDAHRADLVVSAVKALMGTTRLLLTPPTARRGAAPMRAVAPTSEAACRARLAVGEELLRRGAEESRSRWSWTRHAANVGLNVAGALIVAEGFGDRTRGWRSAATGIAVGEAMLFSHPWNADDDLLEYERRFDGADPVRWHVAPWNAGARLVLAF